MQKLTPNIHRMTFSQLIARDWRLYLMLVLPVAYYLIFCYKPMIGVKRGHQFVGVLTQERRHLRPHRSRAQQRDAKSAILAHRFPPVTTPASRAIRSSIVSPRTITRASPRDTATTGGRGT